MACRAERSASSCAARASTARSSPTVWRPIDDETEYDAARALVEKKLRSTRNADPQARWRQLVGLLARRGYSPGLSMRVVGDVLKTEAEFSELVEPDDVPSSRS